jgi:hypothetical protein
VAAVATGLGAFLVYRATLLPGLASWDTGEAQTVLPLMGTMHPTGSPAYVVLGWLVAQVLGPLGSPAFVENLLSAILVSVAVGTTVLVARRLGAGVVVAVATAVGFALTPVVWSLALAADVHALHLALLTIVVGLLLRWESCVDASRDQPDEVGLRRRVDRAIILAAAVFGVAVAVHALALLLIPAIGLYVLAVDPDMLRRRRVVLTAVGACVGVAALLYLELPLRAGPFRAPLVYGHPETWGGFWDIVLARQFQGDVVGSAGDLLDKARTLLSTANAQLGPLIILVPPALLATAIRRPRYALLSGVAAAVTCVFAASYDNAAIVRYYAGPVFFAWTWLAVLGTEVARRLAGAGAGATPDGEAKAKARATTLVAGGIVGVALLVPTVLVLGPRWQAVDRSAETWPQLWLDEASAVLEPNAVVVSWWSYSTPLWYSQLVEGRRPDVRVIDDRTRLDENLGGVRDVIEANIDTRPVYVIRVQTSDVQALTDQFQIEPVGLPGNLFRITGRKETTP